MSSNKHFRTNNNRPTTSTTNLAEEDEEHRQEQQATNDGNGNISRSSNANANSGDVIICSSNVDTRSLGPGAYHVVPLVGGRTSDSALSAADDADGDGDNGNEDDDDIDAVVEDATVAVSATLVVDEDDDNDADAEAHADADTDAGVASSSQPSSSTRHQTVTTVSSTIIAHATPVGSVYTSSLHDDDGGHSRNNEDRNSDDNHNNNNDEEAPVLSLVDQRVVDEHISQLQGEHQRSLKRRTVIGAILALLAVIIVVAVTVPVTSKQREGGGEPDNIVPSDASMKASCAMAELKRRFASSSNSTNEEQTEDGNPYEYYGMWSAISGNTIVVGSPGTEGPGPDGKVHRLGRVHIFEGRQVGGANEEEEEEDGISEWIWEEIPTGALEPSERVTEYGLVASFGFRVTLSDDVLAVTSFTDKAGFPGVGMVYVYRRNADDNTWVEEAIIVPPEDAVEDDEAMAVFGALVAVSGDTMAVASVLRDNARGAVYVYHREVDANGTVSWQEQAKLEASDGMEGDEFGSSLAMDGNTIVVSSVWFMNDDGDIVGKAYIFSKNDEDSWVETDILTASDAQPNAEFGYFVAIAGDTIAVSAPFASRGGEEEPNGMVYIYRYDDTDTVSGGNSTWVETSMLSADDASEFGVSLSMHGEYIVVGAPSAPVGGGIYLYGLEGDDWNLKKKFQYPDTVGFGRSVGISEQAIVVTDPIFTRSGMAQSGAAFAVDFLQSNETLC